MSSERIWTDGKGSFATGESGTVPLASLNTSGFAPLDLRVLVLPDPIEEKVKSIIMPDSVIEQKKWAQANGTIVAVGDNAWEEAKRRAPDFRPPVAGDRVLYAKYAGQKIEGSDGREYQIMNDEDVIARVVAA